MTRIEAEKKLKILFGFDHFYDEQWNAIEKLLRGERVLLIEKTGFGKSLCFQFPATQFEGLTVIFSPLIALMRDQIQSLAQKGIPARCVNSEQTAEENSEAIQQAREGTIKILYIAPERQENMEWIEATREMPLSMVVIDEAHTISQWGHDFRPAFRRIVNLVRLLPENMPVLATTATAPPRVQKDIETQIGASLTTIRGNLLRHNFSLFVLKVKSEEEKLLWLAENLSGFSGTGLIYTGTRMSAQKYADWLNFAGVSAQMYHAGLEAEDRKNIERGLMENQWKCIVSTNALGMGIDKPDIRFVIHTQMPQSPVHYYQEIGRAGRDGNPTSVILFYNETLDRNGVPEDCKLPKSFIETARPPLEKYSEVIAVLKDAPCSEKELMCAANIKQTPTRVIKADLIDQGIIKEVYYGKIKKYEYQYNAPVLNPSTFDALRESKLKELEAMVDYVFTQEPRMKFLCEYLGDAVESNFNNCDNTQFKGLLKTIYDKKTIAQLAVFHAQDFPILSVGTGSCLVDGVAACYYAAPGVGHALFHSKYEGGGDFPDFLVQRTLAVFELAFKDTLFDLIVYVPPTKSGDLVKHFAEKIAEALGIPLSSHLRRNRQTQEQKDLENSYLKRENVKGAFSYAVPEEVQGKRILLIDDIFDSGATIREVGRLFGGLKAKTIAPLVIAKAEGGDI